MLITNTLVSSICYNINRVTLADEAKHVTVLVADCHSGLIIS